jgi:hypothetical protein
MKTFSYSFEELPLLIERDIEAGLVAGCAEISYSRHGEWGIGEIALDGYREASEEEQSSRVGRFIRETVSLDAGTPIHGLIYHRLENEWRGRVEDAVNEQIAADLEAAADDYADMRRDQMMERL